MHFREYREFIDEIHEIIASTTEDEFDEWLAEQTPEFRNYLLLEVMTDPQFTLQPHQIMPDGDWRVWYMRMGRGGGKTRAASTNCHILGRDIFPGGVGLIVGPTVADVREIMILGESGLIATAPPEFEPHFNQHNNTVTWPNGSKAIVRTADNPESIRGHTVNWAWCDELVQWRSEATFDNVMRCVRNIHENGTKLILTTTPKRSKQWLKEIPNRVDIGKVVVTTGSTMDNKFLDAAYLAAMAKDTTSARGREEVLGEDIEADGELWTSENLQQMRVEATMAPEVYLGTCHTRFLSVDPSRGITDETGIMLCGERRVAGRNQVHVIEDHSVKKNIKQWTDDVVHLAKTYFKPGSRDYILIETNGFAGVIESLEMKLKAAGLTYRVIEVVVGNNGKWDRAQKAFTECELGKVWLYGYHKELETQLREWEPVMKNSPDRGDAFTQAINHVTSQVKRSAFPFRRPQ